ncbi:hypothetical protein H7I61_003964 [Salmonella enterica]|nr:hypothetical protein [Salmonella enterica subsp. enterica]EEJ4509234.1 hypothetical protein [Salmonella enterica subsp. enterica serovar Johannesburg]EFS6653964.1 hypothetical protein [Salmonella enterica subsp. enterica serovar Reading]EHM5872912.1 hypothetical protein [Salmonella enterica]EEK2873883.1 hypothetical protein [Salmonella enterica subsp. enterica]
MSDNIDKITSEFIQKFESELNKKVEGVLENKVRGMLVDFRDLQKRIEDFPGLFASKIDDVNDAIRATPGTLEESLQKVFVSVEEMEKTTERLLDDYKVTMRANSINELELIKLKIAGQIHESIQDALDKPLEEAKEKTKEINTILKNGLRAEMNSRVALGLGGLIGIAFLSISGCLAFGILYLQQQDKAEQYYNAFRDQKAVIERMPEGVQRQFREETKKYFNLN